MKVRTDNPFFTPEQDALLTNHILKGAPEFEIDRFKIVCERTGLDPFSGQIYGVVQRKKQKRQGTRDQYDYIPTLVIITSIDGFRAIGERSGQYRGQSKPEWHYVNDEGKSDWHDVFITARDRTGNPMKVPDACRVGVLRDGFPEPCFGVANFDSFAQFYKEEGGGYVLSTFWKKMPEHMIAKVAEAQAFRKAFPLLACGLYVEEEVGRDEDEEAPAAPPSLTPPAETLPWVPGHSPAERAAAAAATPPAPPQPPAAPVTPPAAEKTADDPAEPPAAAKKTRAPKKEAAAAPVEPPADPAEPPQEPAESAPWASYVISQITIAKFSGKKISELTPADIASLEVGWVQKYAEKIKLNPDKVKEAQMISAAHAAHEAAKK